MLTISQEAQRAARRAADEALSVLEKNREAHIVFVGPEWSGRAYAARLVSDGLENLTEAQLRELDVVYEAGFKRGYESERPPFRAPHHTTSAAGLLGTELYPGEASLALYGVLFLEEMPMFRKPLIEHVVQGNELGDLWGWPMDCYIMGACRNEGLDRLDWLEPVLIDMTEV